MRVMARRPTAALCCALLMTGTAAAQDLSGVFGTWKVIATHPLPDPECGARTTTGEMQILQRITDLPGEAYEGRATFVVHSEYCDPSPPQSVGLSLTVDGDRAEISYRKPGWINDLLTRRGTIMEGQDQSGIHSRWEKVAGPSDDARAEEIRRHIAEASYARSADGLRNGMQQAGTAEAEIEPRLRDYFDRKAACEVGAMREVTTEQGLSFYELVNMIDPEGGLTNHELDEVFDTKEYNRRAVSCLMDLNEHFDLGPG